jgi:hypothetical protein
VFGDSLKGIKLSLRDNTAVQGGGYSSPSYTTLMLISILSTVPMHCTLYNPVVSGSSYQASRLTTRREHFSKETLSVETHVSAFQGLQYNYELEAIYLLHLCTMSSL